MCILYLRHVAQYLFLFQPDKHLPAKQALNSKLWRQMQAKSHILPTTPFSKNNSVLT